MWETLTAMAQFRPALAGMALVAVVQLLMVWRRRGADEKSRAHYHGETTVFSFVLTSTRHAQYILGGIAVIQEVGIQLPRVIRAF